MAKFQETDIGSIPSDWRIRSIDGLFTIQQGKSLSAKERTGDYLKPFLRTANVFWGSLDLSMVDEMDIPPKDRERLALRYGDVLVCEGGDIGRTAVWRGELSECYYQNHLHRLRTRPDGDVNPFFFALWMQMAWKYLNVYKGVGNRTTIPNLSSSKLKELLAPIPSLSEQKKIASVLAKIWKTVEIQASILENLRELKKSLMKHLFTYGLRGEPLKKTEIGMMPKSWEVKSLKEMGDCLNGLNFAQDARGDGVPFVNVKNMYAGLFINPVGLERVNLGSKNLDKYFLNKGDILFVRSSLKEEGVGWSAVIKELLEPTVFCGFIIRYRLNNSSQVDADYLGHLLLAQEQREEIIRHSSRMTITNISQEGLGSVRVRLPSLAEQRDIVSILRAVDEKVAIHRAKKSALEDLFKTTLNQLMTGQIRVKDLDIDTSDVEIA